MALLLSFQAIEEIPSVQEKQLDGMKKDNQSITSWIFQNQARSNDCPC